MDILDKHGVNVPVLTQNVMSYLTIQCKLLVIYFPLSFCPLLLCIITLLSVFIFRKRQTDR